MSIDWVWWLHRLFGKHHGHNHGMHDREYEHRGRRYMVVQYEKKCCICDTVWVWYNSEQGEVRSASTRR